MIENIIKHSGGRLDNNFKPDLKSTLKNLSIVLNEKGKTSTKLDYNELIFHLLEYYLINNPEIDKLLLEDRFIKRSMELHEIVKQRRGY
jgi:hypothetical protein